MKLKILGLILIFSVVINILLGIGYVSSRMEAVKALGQIRLQTKEEKSLYFAKLFVEKVLSGAGEVGFEDRLKLENAVRDIEDPKILLLWQNFTESATDFQAQVNAGKLLSALLAKEGS